MRGERNGSTTIALEIILITELTRGGGRATRFLSANFSLAHSFSLSLSLSRARTSFETSARENHRHEPNETGVSLETGEWWKFASRVNLNFFYCVLTCHTCDHAITVSRFFFSSTVPSATDEDRHVWETATCAFLIIPRYFLLARIITPAHVIVPHTRYFDRVSRLERSSDLNEDNDDSVEAIFENKNSERVHFQWWKGFQPKLLRERSRTSCSFYRWWIATISARSSVRLTVYLFRWPVNVAGH